MIVDRIRGFLENIMELGLFGAIRLTISEKVRKIKEFLGYSLEYEININENIDYIEEKEQSAERETETSQLDLLRLRFRMNPI